MFGFFLILFCWKKKKILLTCIYDSMILYDFLIVLKKTWIIHTDSEVKLTLWQSAEAGPG